METLGRGATNAGTKSCHYISPDNTKKFASKAAIERFLNNKNQPKEYSSINNFTLPIGWKTIETVGNGHSNLGRVAHIYVSPTGKRRFPSLAAVERYLEHLEVVKATEKANDIHNHVCSICAFGGDLLCCDYCTLVYHTACLDPPLIVVPEGKWGCPVCVQISEKKTTVSSSSSSSSSSSASSSKKNEKGGEGVDQKSPRIYSTAYERIHLNNPRKKSKLMDRDPKAL